MHLLITVFLLLVSSVSCVAMEQKLEQKNADRSNVVNILTHDGSSFHVEREKNCLLRCATKYA